MELFHTSISSPTLVILTVVYALAAAITTFDIRLIQGKKQGLFKESNMLPGWTAFFAWIMWAAWIAILLLNWWYALALFVIKFILKVLPVLETIGCLLLVPILGKGLMGHLAVLHHQISEQKRAADTLAAIDKNPADIRDILDKYGRDS